MSIDPQRRADQGGVISMYLPFRSPRRGGGGVARADFRLVFGAGAAAVSRTGYLTAWARALSRLSDPAEVANEDDLARHFLLPHHKILNRFPRLTRRLMDARVPGGVAYFNARTKHLDAILQREIDEGLEQLVVLGAGFDSRAMRFDERLGAARVFEVDLPEVLAAKRKHLADAKLRLPKRLTHVGMNFSKDALVEKLVSAGYVNSLRTLVLWEGVTFYLRHEEVSAVLRFVREHTGHGSSVAFDYTTQPFFDGDHSGHGARQLADAWSKMGQVHRSAIGSVSERLGSMGLTVVSDVDAVELERRYLTPRNSRARPPWGVFRIAQGKNVRAV
jgi:methyltransferase (TIGR00027 family)